MRRPLVSLFLAFVIGMVLGRTFLPEPKWVIIFAVISTGVFLAALRRRGKLLETQAWGFILLLVMVLGVLRYSWSEAENERKSGHAFRVSRYGMVQLEATVRSPVEEKPGRFRFTVDEGLLLYQGRRYPLPIKCLVEGKMPKDKPGPTSQIHYGDRVLLKGFLNPVRAASLPGGFDYRQYLAAQNIHGRFWIKGDGLQRLGEQVLSPTDHFLKAASESRLRTLEQIEQTIPPPWSSLMSAILLGERSELPDDLRLSLVHSGLMHLTAVSGLHVTFVVGFMIWFLKFLGMRRRWAALFAAGCIFFFLAMIGFRLPSVRAVLMGFALMLTFILERDVDPLSSVAGAGFLILMLWPLSLFQASFQLSFAAITALTLLMQPWVRLYSGHRGLVRYLWGGLGASLIAQFAVSPLIVHYFSLWTPISLAANLIAVPLAGLLMIFGMGYFALSLVWQSAAILLGYPTFFLLSCLEGLANYFAAIPGGHFFSPAFHPLATFCWYGVLLILGTRRLSIRISSEDRILPKRILILALSACGVWGWVFWPQPRQLEIDFLSLGQGDSIYIEFPEGGNLLVDGGKRWEPKANPVRLVQYLRRRGVSRISAIINTHPQSDHIGNLPEVLEAFEVGAVFHCGAPGEGPVYELFDKAAREEGAPYRAVRRGQQIHGFSGVTLDVLAPSPRYSPDDFPDLNYQSVVLRLEYGDFSCLLTGDIPGELEEELVEQGLARETWILKVAHHGSKYSSTENFLSALHPQVAVIQVGRNSFGHPAKQTLQRLEEAGSLVLRNDYEGTIRVTTDGKTYTVRSVAKATRYVKEQN